MFNPISFTYGLVIGSITFTWTNFVWAPLLLFFNILIFTPLFKIPLYPFRYLLSWGDTPVDSAWLFDQFQLFFLTMLHFGIASCLIGLFIGVLTGMYLKMIRFMFSIVIPRVEEKVKVKVQEKVMDKVQEVEKRAEEKLQERDPELYKLLNASITNVTIETAPLESDSTSAGTEYSDFSRVTTSESESREWNEEESVASLHSESSEDTIDHGYARDFMVREDSELRSRNAPHSQRIPTVGTGDSYRISTLGSGDSLRTTESVETKVSTPGSSILDSVVESLDSEITRRSVGDHVGSFNVPENRDKSEVIPEEKSVVE